MGLPYFDFQGFAVPFTRGAGAWVEGARIEGSLWSGSLDGFGAAVAVFDDLLVIGAPHTTATYPGAGVAYVFEAAPGGGWKVKVS